MDFENFRAAVEARRSFILDAERHLWRTPEPGFREWKTHAYLKAQFESLGLAPREFDRIPASIARKSSANGKDRVFGKIPGFFVDFDTGRPGPRLAIFGEMDSLIVPSHPECDKETGAVHSCGHHAQGAALLGVATALASPGALNGLSGSIRLIAVPAEEFIELGFRKELRAKGVVKYLSGKQELIYRGLLDDVDLAFMVHTSVTKRAMIANAGSDGFISTEHVFLGKAAHAGGAPQNGLNALYAANLAINAANALRETFVDAEHIRFHPIITNGGAVANSIPDHVVVESCVRASTVDGAIRVNKRINRAFAGAAAAMGCRLEVHDLCGYLPRFNSPEINQVFHDVAAGVFGEENLDFGDGWGTGCSDMGDVSALMPAAHPYVGGATGTEHGSNYAIVDPGLACVTCAAIQAAAAAKLLGNDASLARGITAAYKPVFASPAEYLAAIDGIEFNGEVVEYGEKGGITIREASRNG